MQQAGKRMATERTLARTPSLSLRDRLSKAG